MTLLHAEFQSLAPLGLCRRWVIHVIPAIPACQVRPKSGHSVEARVYECAAENKFLEIKTLRRAPGAALLGQHVRDVVIDHELRHLGRQELSESPVTARG